ncbi:MAG: hypothetical protein GXP48_02295 [Acidobacteria bacterium]|nr:hypothetical protein [Acidobacteriota bacterium]
MKRRMGTSRGTMMSNTPAMVAASVFESVQVHTHRKIYRAGSCTALRPL